MRAEDFLEIYRQLEDALEKKYSGEKRKYSSVVIEFLNSNESLKFRDKLNLAREIRNLLSHSAKIEGEDVVSPSDKIAEALKEVIAYINEPPLAIEFATRPENILFANINQTVLKIMGLMKKNGFSHVPIMLGGEVVGVFSKSTIFEYVINNYSKPISKLTTIKELGKLLPVKRHTENYLFENRYLTLNEAIEKFEKVKEKDKRVAVIFITENGRDDERLLGMLTPLDVMGERV